MRFLIDANLPRSIIALIASLGHEVEFARDVGLAAAPDHEIAASPSRVGDFGEKGQLKLTPNSHPAVLETHTQ